MDTIFMNSENSKTSEPRRLLLNLGDKINLKRTDVALSNLSMYYKWNNITKSYKNNKFKISALHGMQNLIYLMDHTLYEIFKVILNISLKKTQIND